MKNLLWFCEDPPQPQNLFSPETLDNLDFYSLSDQMRPENTVSRLSAEQLGTLFCDDREIILKRQEVIKELLQRPDLMEIFTELIERINGWEELFSVPDLGDNPEDINPFDVLDSYRAADEYLRLIQDAAAF